MAEADFTYAEPSMPAVKRGLIRIVEAATGRRHLRRLYLSRRPDIARGHPVFVAAVECLDLDVRHDAEALARIPATGPLVVVANHPYGVLDGIVVSWLIGQVRSDFAVLTHAALTHLPEIKPHLLPVDFSGTAEAAETNLRSRAAAHRLLADGGCVIVFPAGGIATAPDRLGLRPAVDAPWQPFTAQLIQRSRATVVPMRFDGQNSRLFQIASHINPALRLSLIFHEVRRRIGTSMRVSIGRPIPFADLPPAVLGRQHLMLHLRSITEALGRDAGAPTVDRLGRLKLPFGPHRLKLPFRPRRMKFPFGQRRVKLPFEPRRLKLPFGRRRRKGP